MYPNLCFANSMYEVDASSGEKLREVLEPEEYAAVLESGNYNELQDYSYEGSTDPVQLLKDIMGAVVNEASKEAQNQAFAQLIARPMIAGYIGADSKGNSADQRLKTLRVIDGLSGIDLSASKFFEDGNTIDIVACYTIDPIMPIKIMPEINLCNRAVVQGMTGSSIFN